MALNMIWLRWNNMLLNMNRCVLFEYGLIYDSLPSLRSPILIGIIIKRSEAQNMNRMGIKLYAAKYDTI